MGQPKPKAVEGTVVQLPDRRPLTAKQERFARLYIELGNASEAYRRAYDAGDMQDETVRVEASRVLANPNITLRTQQIEAEAVAVTQLTVGRLVSEAFDLVTQAKDGGDTRGAIAAIAVLERLLARAQPLGSDRRAVEDLSDAELMEIAAQRGDPERDKRRALELLQRLDAARAASEVEFPILASDKPH
jgi:phage terminase small subunit